MNKPITIKELYKECEEQIKKGNGDKYILISQDDEGNGYHYLWYSFTTMEEHEKEIEFNGKKFKFEFTEYDERIAPKEKHITLG